MRHSHTVQRRRTIQRSLRRLKHRIKRLATSYVSPLGWAVAALAVASLVAFVLLGWHELLAMAADGRDKFVLAFNCTNAKLKDKRVR
ncbi:hypothetical protein PL375_04665, partial [Bifidobacterium adolescentis]|nr:hypothetical protein [Bifidobacterium adolescentis]